ncbi:MAG: helix-turn-helix domain-containing protein [Bauldia sp.]
MPSFRLPPAQHERLDAVIRAVRACFGALREAGDRLHADLGISSAMRAVMEFVAEQPATVPDIARAKRVSRQNIQVLVDALLGSGMLVAEPNAAHRRSPLIALSRPGKVAYRRIAERERAALAEIAAAVSAADLDSTHRTLAMLTERLAARAEPVEIES